MHVVIYFPNDSYGGVWSGWAGGGGGSGKTAWLNPGSGVHATSMEVGYSSNFLRYVKVGLNNGQTYGPWGSVTGTRASANRLYCVRGWMQGYSVSRLDNIKLNWEC